MKTDIAVISFGFLLVGITSYVIQGNSHEPKHATTQSVRVLADDPNLKLVSKNSPYMRTER